MADISDSQYDDSSGPELRKLFEENASLMEQIEAQRAEIKAQRGAIKANEAMIADLTARVNNLTNQVDYWRKRFYGRMSEKKHLPLDPGQLSLFSEVELAQMTPQETEDLKKEAETQEQAIEKTIKARAKGTPKRKGLDTTGLEVRETHIWPDGTTDGKGNLLEEYVEIGIETSDLLEKEPAKVYVARTVRHKVIARSDMSLNAEERSILAAPLPQKPVDKGMAGATVLTDIILGKYLYHLPFYRQISQYRENGLRIPASTIEGWYEDSVESLHYLYRLLRQRVMSSEYIQVDESTVPVIDNEKHRTRKGYEWCVRDGITGQLFFWYDRGSRSKKTARELLGGYRGVFQSDGYEAYDQFCDIAGVTGAACWAHARRKFVEALKEDKALATQAIVMIGKLYAVEEEADEAGMDAMQRMELRRQRAYPVIRLMEKWCLDTYARVLEKSLLGKAIAYTYSLMERLSVYVSDGRINIDNNLIENAIRPLALGRKNWLFCGNDASAYRAAIVYSLTASCRAAGIDPRQWMEEVLVEIPRRRKASIPLDDLLPAVYALRPGVKKWNIPDPD